MSVRKILEGDIPDLRIKSEKITEFGESLNLLLQDLRDTLSSYRGLGLSAPQIGVFRRVFVTDIGLGIQEFVNPQILKSGGKVEAFESCLSLPEYSLKIARPQHVTITAQNRQGDWFDTDATDLLARVLCHQVEHLDGTLFVDWASDEDIFTQLLGNGFILNSNAGENLEEENRKKESWKQRDEKRQLEAQDIQLATDMLSDASWKITLALEILKDYRKIFYDKFPRRKLKVLTKALQQSVDCLEQHLEETLKSD